MLVFEIRKSTAQAAIFSCTAPGYLPPQVVPPKPSVQIPEPAMVWLSLARVQPKHSLPRRVKPGPYLLSEFNTGNPAYKEPSGAPIPQHIN